MKTISLFTISALCLFGISGCDNDMRENTELQPGQKVLMTIKTAGPQTRAEYTGSGAILAFSWNISDQISVVVDGVPANNNCLLDCSTSGKSVPFSGTVTSWSGTKNIYAFYPYSPAGYSVTGGDDPSTATATLTLPNPQSYTVNGPISNSFLVGAGTATSSGGSIDASASMKQVMSIIKLNITNAPDKVTSIRLFCSEAIFPTTATVKLADGTISNPGQLVNELYMNVDDANVSQDKNISFAMFPANLLSKNINIEVSFYNGLAKSIVKQGLSFDRNIHYVVNINASDAEIPYLEVGGLKWATGNLVAYGANDAKVGSSRDGGLYFQYGSLLGWSGGANGDGTGRGANNADPSLALILTPPGYGGDTGWSSSWSGDVSVDNPSTGNGDPCRYYLGGTWRLPTNAEYTTLFSSSGYPFSGPWTASGNFAIGSSNSYASHTLGLKFPAAGYRLSTNGSLADVGEYGYNWSSIAGLGFTFDSSSIESSFTTDLANGFPVRCVKD